MQLGLRAWKDQIQIASATPDQMGTRAETKAGGMQKMGGPPRVVRIPDAVEWSPSGLGAYRLYLARV
jgi:hypothetical protein